jgi:hypothetical protein
MIDMETVTKERISDVIDRFRGVGGLPPSPTYVKSLKYWLSGLSRRGFLQVDFLSNKERVRDTFMEAFPNSSSRSQFTRAILTFISLLTDEEFQHEFPGLSREDAVRAVRAVAKVANKDRNDKALKRT